MKNDIKARAEQLGHEAEGLRYFSYDTMRPKTPIVEMKLGKFERVLHYDEETEGETTYLIFKGVLSPCEYGQGLTYIEKLLSGEVFKHQDTIFVCRDRAKLVARIEAEQKEELRRRQLERQQKKMGSIDWEERTWTLLNDLVVSNLQLSDSEVVYTLDELVCIARETVDKYKKSMEEKE